MLKRAATAIRWPSGAKEVQSALLAVLRGEESVQMRLMALDQLAASGLGAERFTERIAALRARILALRPRIARALRAHLSYVDALALRELESRRNRLRAFL